MRILLPTIRDAGQIGGTTTHLDMLARGLEEIGHEPRVLYLGAALPGRAGDLGIAWPAGALNRLRRGWGMVYAAAVRGRLLAAVTARELARAQAAGEPWQVLNAQEVYSVPALRGVADRFGIPLVLTLHGYPLYESMSEGYSEGSRAGRRFLMSAELRALRVADAVVTVDSRLHRHVLRLAPDAAGRTSALMNFIDTSSFYPSLEGREELRREWNVPAGRTVLFCPRRLVKKNGVVYPALALAAMSAEQRKRFLLLHAGEGGEREAIERTVAEHGLGDCVRLLGGRGREAILDLFRLADIILVPSVHSENVEEATSLSALEAMACGRPLIAGAVGGLAEMIEDGGNGLLVPAADPRALADAVLRLADDPGLGARLAEVARRYVVENHSHLKAAASYAEIYQRAGAADSEGASGVAGRRAAAGADAGADVGVVAAGSPTPGAGSVPPDRAMPDQPARPSISVLGFPFHRVGLEEAAAWVLEQAARPGGVKAAAPSTAAAGAGPSIGGPGGDTSGLGGPAGGAPGPGGPGGAAAFQVTRTAVSFNPELVIRAQRDPAAAEALLAADLRYPDGVGVVWAAARRGARGLERVPGIELAERVLEGAAAEGLGVYLLGAAPGVANEAAEALRARYPGLWVAGTGNGYFAPEDEADVVARIRDSGAAVLFAALGAPRQELFIHRNRRRLGAGVALGVGGSFDVWAGRVSRAPGWARSLGVEWLYRLLTDPRRLRRQLALPVFAVRVLADVSSDYHRPRGT
ncbi:MAG: WecB/TagA/CpsF family glycosyltransferase [Thermoleophilia bacterium]